MAETKIIMSISILQEKIEEIIDEGLKVYVTENDSDEIIAVLIPIEEYEDLKETQWMYEQLQD